MNVTDSPAPFYTGDGVTIWHGNALALPIPDESVDLCVTSPPYFGLRSYTDDGEHYDGQIGSEATPREFLDALIAATAEMVRVLKPSGSIWVNLGDKYAQPGKGERNRNGLSSTVAQHGEAVARNVSAVGQDYGGIPGKSLMGLPWRYAIRCIDELGLILRAEVVWSKPNGLPESVTDRVRRSHEQWFHFTREPRYFSAVDEIREQYAPETAARYASGYKQTGASAAGQTANGVLRKDAGGPADTNPLGKLPGSVWEVPTQPLKVPTHLTQHFAAFPIEWPRRIIRGWSPSGVCLECGEGRRPVAEDRACGPRDLAQRSTSHYNTADRYGPSNGGNTGMDNLAAKRRAGIYPTITGYACACDAPTAPTQPAVVLDPFGGTGTTALVAKALGRIGWHVDLSADYCRLAQWRVNDPGEMARAMQVEKPPAAPEDMDSLLDLLADGAA